MIDVVAGVDHLARRDGGDDLVLHGVGLVAEHHGRDLEAVRRVRHLEGQVATVGDDIGEDAVRQAALRPVVVGGWGHGERQGEEDHDSPATARTADSSAARRVGPANHLPSSPLSVFTNLMCQVS